MAVRIILFFFLSLTLLRPLGTNGQNQYPHFTHITTRDGLTSNIVYSIHQDRTGFLWLGSYNCLTRYDGYTFKHYQHDASDPGSFPSGVAVSISEDPDGNLWLVDGVGILRKFKPKTEE